MQETDQTATRLPSVLEKVAGNPADYALFLDLDGTLLDIALTPDRVTVPAGLVELLVRLSKGLDGAMAILTGRQLAEIDALLAPAKFVGSGVHGTELRTTTGGPITRVATALPPTLVEELVALARSLPGIIAETKGPGVAIHYRLAPHLEPLLEREITRLLESYRDSLVLCPGRKLIEIIPAGHSKGTALETLARLPAFSGRLPVMIGDDAGDVPALLAAERLGGIGLRVGGEHFGRTRVDLAGPQTVIAWLQRLAQALEA